METSSEAKMAILVGIAGLGCVGVYLTAKPRINETEEQRIEREKKTCLAVISTGLLLGTAAVFLKVPAIASAVAAKTAEANLEEPTLQAGVTATAPTAPGYQLPPSGSRERWYYDNLAEAAGRNGSKVIEKLREYDVQSKFNKLRRIIFRRG